MRPARTPLAPWRVFVRRVLVHGGAAVLIVAGALFVGAAGYAYFARESWLDATYDAAMILTGMGPTGKVATPGGKLFVTGYALFSGVVFLGATGLLLTPLVHRLLHRFHLEDTSGDP